MERLRYIGPLASDEPQLPEPGSRPVPAPPAAPVPLSYVAPLRGRERELQQLINDLAILAERSHPAPS